MEISKQIHYKKVRKLLTKIKTKFVNEPQLDGFIITPGKENWPTISKDIAYKLAGPQVSSLQGKREWNAFPLVVKLKEDNSIVEFIIIAKNAPTAWHLWVNIIESVYSEKETLNPYQIAVFNYMIQQTSSFKTALELNNNCVLQSYICPLPLIVQPS